MASSSQHRRHPRPDPRPGRPGQQPEGRQRRDPQAAADGVHRRLGIGQVVAGVRHHRGRVAAADQRDLQRVPAELHADDGPARGRRPRRADDRDHRRPGADGRQRALDGRHGDRRQRDAARAVEPPRQAAHRAVDGLLVQRPDAQSERGDDRRQGQGRADRRPRRRLSRRHVPAMRGHGTGQRHRPVAALRRQQVAQRGRAHGSRLHRRGLARAHLRGRGPRPGQADPQVHARRSATTSSTRSRAR